MSGDEITLVAESNPSLLTHVGGVQLESIPAHLTAPVARASLIEFEDCLRTLLRAQLDATGMLLETISCHRTREHAREMADRKPPASR